MEQENRQEKDKFTRVTTIIGLLIAILAPTLFTFIANRHNNKLALLAQDSLISTQEKYNESFLQTQTSFQSEVEATQATVIRKSESANIYVEKTKIHTWDFTGAFRITNNGPATANNIWISIHMYDLNPLWTDYINEISIFPITYEPRISKPTIEYSRSEGFYDSVTKDINNEIQIFIEQLPPNNPLIINIGRPDIPTVHNYVETRVVCSPNVSTDLINDWDLRQPFEENFYISKFTITIGCENCSDFEELNGVTVTSLGVLEVDNNVVDTFTVTGINRSVYKVRFSLLFPTEIDTSDLSQDLNLEYVIRLPSEKPELVITAIK